MKCFNCERKADYRVADAGVNPVDYCNPCLPKHLRERALAGHFPLPKEDKKAEKAAE
jgi:hypothetical protein